MWGLMILGLLLLVIIVIAIRDTMKHEAFDSNSEELCKKYKNLIAEHFKKMCREGYATQWWLDLKLKRLEDRLEKTRIANEGCSKAFDELYFQLKDEYEVLSRGDNE